MNDNQIIVLDWLKAGLETASPFSVLSTMLFFEEISDGLSESNIKMCIARKELNDEEFLQVIAAFTEYGLSENLVEQYTLF